MIEHVEVAVIGAGPAGMSAATWLAERGVSTLVLDEQQEPGGQIYRSVERVAESAPSRLAALGSDYAHGRDVVRAFRASGCTFWPGSTVWQISSRSELWVSRNGVSRKIVADRIILATGAMERPVPVPGWTLPGVLTVGALQILLKGSGMAVDGDLILIGSGPLLYLFVSQCLALGLRPAAFLDTSKRSAPWRAAHLMPAALRGHGLSYIQKGLRLKAELRRSGIPVFTECDALRIEGEDSVRSVSFRSGGKERTIQATAVALHEGVIPLQQLARQAGCRHVWDARQQCFRPWLDEWGNSSTPGIMIVGDGAGIGGARAAEHAGRIAALAAARTLCRIDDEERDRIAAGERRELARHLSVRPLLDALYAPAVTTRSPDDKVIACRCEEVTAQAVRATAALGNEGPDQMKRVIRCGMGPCQGRMCGPVVSQLIADVRGCSPGEVGYYNVRPPLKPLPLAEIALIDREGYTG
ncbi:FAD/NAD(P)-binding oxidoreductase [Sphingobium sp. SCG-1]|uniref:FAD/NAD(P)-dependent oxidoreductase n=1 Tax=Sphingobium sp. SCG-1 TaxID=2072936 RepID=UPI000CD6BC74|nr:NAD(P)/FAD-dependent oxidoreductase [Sphingobium sp. SCG-1]AUW59784.1 FAD/NAD(P)-binding oxidoreductase [Sphingobium sp. SCG-1]